MRVSKKCHQDSNLLHTYLTYCIPIILVIHPFVEWQAVKNGSFVVCFHLLINGFNVITTRASTKWFRGWMGRPTCDISVATLLLEECEDDTHTPEMGTWESTGTPETSEFDYRGQNASHWNVLYVIGKLSKCRCRKWARMNHLDI